MEAKLFIPSHAEPTEDIGPLARINIDSVYETAEKIMHICKEPVSFEMILERMFDQYQLTMNFEQYVLAGSTVRSCLTWLKDAGRLQAVFEKNLLLWEM